MSRGPITQKAGSGVPQTMPGPAGANLPASPLWDVATPPVDVLAPEHGSDAALPPLASRPIPRALRRMAGVHTVFGRAAGLMPNGALICVSGTDGGTGRSTLTAALGGLLATAAPRPVLAVDATMRPWGGLAHRVTLHSQATTTDAAEQADQLTTPEDFIPLVQRASGGLDVLLGERELAATPSFHALAPVIARARRWYSATLLDLPTADVEWARAALWSATAPVLVARATADSLRHVQHLLVRLADAGFGEVTATALVVVMTTSPRVDREALAITRAMRAGGTEVLRIPYDPHLAHPEPIDLSALRRRTTGALVQVAAAVLARCPAVLEPPIWQPSDDGDGADVTGVAT
ncbi:hypothetical protein Lfu02_14800 [Longispora fulva]|uniref:MinD-like ATPase involved in chromosome partitioning or flagellar assembly n=1 Tax=Longispora fulva TaxID=619741 RepID=A0A8J7GVS9_9ACTN|nr:hypothetical protein [Longispora fulva]MBG6140510.1 MinD-like ATPase involved in chromosome partitioning or flagellar assembly [Longispora fulva]GIG57108.1 hypothetical protein Lfu02_14800 [Longispora fulva]